MKLLSAVLFILSALMPATLFAQQWHTIYPTYPAPYIVGPSIYVSPPIYVGPPIYVNPPIYYQTWPHPIYAQPAPQYWHNGYWYRGEHTGWQWLWSDGHWSTSPYCAR